ncbi:chaplin family protein [Actinomadura mexicana]|uniref:Small secreted domain n=1 Tax=Actinomadura mexicana TaxID=134959 RepID=A0A239H923_9ACTN|nr:chaplin family protein [Actinomadura mexicana]SNS77936.1 Small secreted domain [Actinomadura mexicana]
MIKKLAATGILGFAMAGSALAVAPAYAATYGGGWDDHGKGHHGKGHHDKDHHGKGHHGKGHDENWFSHNKTSDNFGILNGTQVIAPISVPVDVCGNAIAVLGGASAHCKGGSSVNYGH